MDKNLLSKINEEFGDNKKLSGFGISTNDLMTIAKGRGFGLKLLDMKHIDSERALSKIGNKPYKELKDKAKSKSDLCYVIYPMNRSDNIYNNAQYALVTLRNMIKIRAKIMFITAGNVEKILKEQMKRCSNNANGLHKKLYLSSKYLCIKRAVPDNTLIDYFNVSYAENPDDQNLRACNLDYNNSYDLDSVKISANDVKKVLNDTKEDIEKIISDYHQKINKQKKELKHQMKIMNLSHDELNNNEKASNGLNSDYYFG